MGLPTDKTLKFLQLHWEDIPERLLFNASRYPEVDMPWVAQQIEGRKQAQIKWPSLVGLESLYYPPRLNREQASSEQLAQYKSMLLPEGTISLADLTGGMGVDSYYFSKRCRQVDYVELDEELCLLAAHNFQQLEAGNIQCYHKDSMAWIAERKAYDVIYIDPARRSQKGRKVSAFEDCTPNLLEHLGLLKNHCRRLIVKASPMISIPEAVLQLGNVSEVHVLALQGECKEVLFVLEQAQLAAPVYHCLNLGSGQPELTFQDEEELRAFSATVYCTAIQRFLYEPNAAIMKSGFYNSVACRYGLKKLARNTHLYTADILITDFPGRVFEVLSEVKLNARVVASLIPERKAHVVSRNYPDTAQNIMQKLKLSEGGTQFIIATTLGTRPTAFLANRVIM